MSADKTETPAPDFTFENHGTIYMLYPKTEAAQAWLYEHAQSEPYQWFGGALCVEHRYIEPLLEGIREEGFAVEQTS